MSTLTYRCNNKPHRKNINYPHLSSAEQESEMRHRIIRQAEIGTLVTSNRLRSVHKYRELNVVTNNQRYSSLLSRNLKIKIYSTITLPVVLYGCETWSLTLREERRLRVFENRVLRRVFGPKRYEVTGEWRKLHNEELSDLYSFTQYCAGG